MKKAIVVVGMVAMFAGCAFNPESMPIGQKDSTVYVDAGAPKKLATQESKAKVSVIVSLGKFKKAGESLDSFLNARLAGFSFFQVVDRKSQAALIKDAVASGAGVSDIDLSGEEADYVIFARLASLNAQSAAVSSEAVFDFKWIDTETKRVVMTESFKQLVSGSNAQLEAAIANAAELVAKEFCAKIAVKYTPPARVLETRGNGAAARISVGTNYGVAKGTKVCFYEIVDNSNVGGEKRDMRDIATGEVKLVEEKVAWVEVDNAEQTNVRKGVYVRVLGLAKKSLLGGLKDVATETASGVF